MNLATQVADQANPMDTKDISVATMQKLINQLQGEIKTLKTKQSGQVTKKPETSEYTRGNWWSNP